MQTLKTCLERLSVELGARGTQESRDACKEAIDKFQLIDQGMSPMGMADQFWNPFKLACHIQMPSRVREVALDCIQKLIAFGLLVGNSAAPPPSLAVPGRRRSSIFRGPDEWKVSMTSVNSASSINLVSLIDDIVLTVCSSFSFAGGEETVQLQVVKVLLTAVTSPHCQIHGSPLLKIVESCFSIHVNSKNQVNQNTAKASLTQIINLKFQVLEQLFRQAPKVSIPLRKPRRGSIEGQKSSSVEGGESSNQLEMPSDGSPIRKQSITKSLEFAFASSGASVPDKKPLEDEQNKLTNDENPWGTEEVSDKELLEPSPEDQSGVADEPLAEQKVLLLVLIVKKIENTNNGPENQATEEKEPAKQISVSDTTKDTQKEVTEDPDEAKRRLVRKDCFIIFRLLCRVSMQADTPEARSPDSGLVSAPPSTEEISPLTLRARILALEMILSILQNAGPAFLSDEVNVKAVRQYLCTSISRNGVSSNPMLFEYSISTFLLVLRYFRDHLKSEVGILMNTVYINILEMNNSSFKQKSLILQALQKICESPQILADLFLNYDCDLNSVSVFDKIVNVCSRIAQGKGITASTPTTFLAYAVSAAGLDSRGDQLRAQEKILKIKSLYCLVAIAESLGVWADLQSKASEEGNTQTSPVLEDDEREANTATPVSIHIGSNPLKSVSVAGQLMKQSADTMSASPSDESLLDTNIMERAQRKQAFRKAIRLFNLKPQKGMQQLIKAGFVEKEEVAVARLLMDQPELNKAAIGDYIGDNDPFNKAVMHHFIDMIDLKGRGFVDALRHLLQTFRLPGESQKIDRIMEKFADKYCEDNVGIFAKADTAYTLAYSVIMLNTDQHSPQIKHRMEKPDFIKNNRGINDNSDLPEEYLGAIFDEIRDHEIIMEEEHTGKLTELGMNLGAGDLDDQQRMDLYYKEVAQIQKKSLQLIKAAGQTSTIQFVSASQKELARPMFSLVSWPLMAAFSVVFESSTGDEEPNQTPSESKDASMPSIIDLCLQGLGKCVQLSSFFRMNIERDALVKSLTNLTCLSRVRDIKMKNVRAMKLIIELALSHGDHLENSWRYVMKVLSQIERLRLALDGQLEETGDLPSEGSPVTPRAGFTQYTVDVINFISDPVNEDIISELTGQNLMIQIDSLFSRTPSLSPSAILSYLRGMCLVSLEEVGFDIGGIENIESLHDNHDLKFVKSPAPPRMYLLQKVVEIAYYNMHRIRYEWSQIWKILQFHFNTVACHPNEDVATFTIDSIRQLCMKFLERDELSHFNTQSDILRSFEHIMRSASTSEIRILIVQSISQMVVSKASNIKSGWKSILITLSRVCSVPNASEDLLSRSFELIQTIESQYADLVLASGTFSDFIGSLTEFALLDSKESPKHEEIVTNALQIIQLYARKTLTMRSRSSSQTSPDLNSKNTTAVGSSSHGLNEDAFSSKWLPILSSLSRVSLESPSAQVRSQSVEMLFESLGALGTLFETKQWKAILSGVIFPLLERLCAEDNKEGFSDERRLSGRLENSSATLVHGLRLLVNLATEMYTHFISIVNGHEVLTSILALILSTYGKSNENVSKTGNICFIRFLTSNAQHIVQSPEPFVNTVTESIEHAFHVTLPAGLVNCDYPQRDRAAHLSEISQESSKEDMNDQDSPLSISFNREIVPSDTTKTVLRMVVLFGTDIAKSICKETMTLDTLNFDEIVVKCGLHLELVDALRNLLLAKVKAADGTTTVSLVNALPTALRKRWIDCIYESYCVARAFNSNYDLRHAMLKKGLIPHLPNLIKQETTTSTSFIKLLFEIYRVQGDVDDNEVLDPLIRETMDVLYRVVDLLAEQQKNGRDIVVWSSTVTMIIDELISLDGLWDKSAAKYRQLRVNLPEYYRAVTRMVICEKIEVRIAIQKLLRKFERMINFEV